MDQLNEMTERKDTLNLTDVEFGDNSFIQLVDTLLLTLLDIISGKAKISNAFINAELREFKLQRPNSNANIIIQYDLKPVNESLPYFVRSETVSDGEEDHAYEFTNGKGQCLEKEIELQFTPRENYVTVSNGDHLHDKTLLSNFDNVNNYKQPVNSSFSYLNNNMPTVHMHSLVAENKTFSSIEKLTPQEASFDKCLSVEENKSIQSCEKPHSCSVCGKTFLRVSHKRRHEKTHTEEKPYTCSVCGKNFSQLSYKDAHEKLHSEEKPYTCSTCGKNFSRLSYKKSHERIHTGEKPYPCSVCGRYFATISNKIEHERTHLADKAFGCRSCGKTFVKSVQRSAHEQMHSVEKKYACSICGKSFMKSSDRIKHERIHTGEKPYSCSFCGRSFSQSTSKIAHERIHTGEKPYSCRLCGKSFSTSSQRLVHEKKHSKQPLCRKRKGTSDQANAAKI